MAEENAPQIQQEQNNAAEISANSGKFTGAQKQDNAVFRGAENDGADGAYRGEEQKPENTGAFKAKEHEKKKKEKGPGYTTLDLGQENDAAEWVIGMLSGRLQNYFTANLKFVSYYVAAGLDKVADFLEKSKESKKLGEEKDGKTGKDGKDGKTGKDGKDGKTGKDGKDGKTGKDGKDGKDKGNKDKGGKEVKTSAQQRNDHKAQKAQETLNKAQKNMANRRYDNSALGKNQKAFDEMTIESLKHEAAYRKNVAANPGYANSPEGRAARAELVSDRKTLAAMQKETAGVNNKIVDGKINKKTKAQKAVQRARIGLKVAGAAAKEQKGKIAKKVKQAQQKGMKKLKQKTNIKNLTNLKSQLKNMMRQKTNTQSRQQGKAIAVAASKKRTTTR